MMNAAGHCLSFAYYMHGPAPPFLKIYITKGTISYITKYSIILYFFLCVPSKVDSLYIKKKP